MIENPNNYVESLISIKGATMVDPENGTLNISRTGRGPNNALFKYDDTKDTITLKDSDGNSHTITGIDISAVNINNLKLDNPPQGAMATCSALLDCTRTEVTDMYYDNYFSLSSLSDLIGNMQGHKEMHLDIDAITNPTYITMTPTIV